MREVGVLKLYANGGQSLPRWKIWSPFNPGRLPWAHAWLKGLPFPAVHLASNLGVSPLSSVTTSETQHARGRRVGQAETLTLGPTQGSPGMAIGRYLCLCPSVSRSVGWSVPDSFLAHAPGQRGIGGAWQAWP